MKPIFLTAILLVLIVTACNNRKDINNSGEKKAMEIGQLAFSYPDGRPVPPELFRGKTVFINFWATWCKPCVAEMPSLQRMVDKLSADSLVFLFASDENAEDITRFQQAKGYRLPFVRSIRDAGLTAEGLPVTAIFDRSGRLVFSELGARAWDSEESLQLIEKIVQQP